MAKQAAFGTIFKRGSTAIAYVTNVGGPSLAADTEDVTSHDSTGAWEEHVVTILRSGEVSLDLEYDPLAATHKNASGGLLYDLASRASTTFSITFPDTTVWSFTAFVTGFEPAAPHDGALTATVTLKLTAPPTLA